MAAVHGARRLKATARGFCGACDARTNAHETFEAAGYRILRCGACGTLFTDVAEDFDSAPMYGEAYFEGGQTVSYVGYGASTSVLEREFGRSLALLRRWVSGGRLLEVGAAYGMFLRVASRYFRVEGVDISAAAAAAARRTGADVRVLDLCAADDPKLEGPWDAVVLFDTIEHLRRPLRVLRRLHAVMRPGGVLLLTTGDVDSAVARLSGRRWRLLTPPEHLFFFDRASITRLLGESGFDVVRVDRPWKIVPLGLVIHRMLRTWAPNGRLARRLVGWGIPLNLFDTMRVVAIRRP